MPLDTFPKTPFIQTSVSTKFAFMSNYQCKDSICNDPKFVLGSNVKSPNNKFVERGCQITRLTLKEKRLNLTFIDGLTPI